MFQDLNQLVLLNITYTEEKEMVSFISKMIINARQKSLENGQSKYRAYFINTHLYADYRSQVNAELLEKDCSDCIIIG